jgi:hypothetical protein
MKMPTSTTSVNGFYFLFFCLYFVICTKFSCYGPSIYLTKCMYFRILHYAFYLLNSIAHLQHALFQVQLEAF